MGLHIGNRPNLNTRQATDAVLNDMQLVTDNFKFGGGSFETGVTDPYITLQNTLNLNTMYTVEFFVFHSTTPGSGDHYINITDAARNNSIEITEDGEVRAKIPGNGFATGSVTGFPLANNQWHHILLVFDTSQGFQMYFNGNRAGNGGTRTSFSNLSPIFNSSFTQLSWKSPLYSTVNGSINIDAIRISSGDPYGVFSTNPATISVPTSAYAGGIELYHADPDVNPYEPVSSQGFIAQRTIDLGQNRADAMCYLPDLDRYWIANRQEIRVFDSNFQPIDGAGPYTAGLDVGRDIEGMAYDPISQTVAVSDQTTTVRYYNNQGNIKSSIGSFGQFNFPNSISSIGFSPSLNEWFYHNRSDIIYFANGSDPTTITRTLTNDDVVNTSDVVAAFYGLDGNLYFAEWSQELLRVQTPTGTILPNVDLNSVTSRGASNIDPETSVRSAEVNWDTGLAYIFDQTGNGVEYEF